MPCVETPPSGDRARSNPSLGTGEEQTEVTRRFASHPAYVQALLHAGADLLPRRIFIHCIRFPGGL